MNDLIIAGTGVHAAEMAEMVERINLVSQSWNLLGYITTEEKRIGESYNGYKIIGTKAVLAEYPNAYLVPDNEWPLCNELPRKQIISLIDPQTVISRTAQIGIGCVIYPNCFIGLNALVGDFVFCLSGAVINHDCQIANRVVMATGVTLAGSVQVEAGSYLGQSCSIRQFMKVGASSLVGMGSIIVKDVPTDSIVVGNPAQAIRKNSPSSTFINLVRGNFMNYRILGKSGLNVSEISLGCWAIGGPKWTNGRADGWSGNNDDQSLQGLRKSYELGINHLDTADGYGDGHSERLIGRFLKEIPRDHVIVGSKVGGFRGTALHPMQPVHIRNQLEQTLTNLGTEYVDIYYFHNANFGVEDCYLEEASEMIRTLQKEGKIRVIGQSAYSYEDFIRVCDTTKPDIIQFHYNALGSSFDQPETNIFEWADKQNIGIVVFGPMAQGILLDKFDPDFPPLFGEGDMRAEQYAFTREGLLAVREKLKPIKERFGSSIENMIRVSLQFALAQSKNACVIPGFKNAHQVVSNAQASNLPLTDEDVTFLRRVLHQ